MTVLDFADAAAIRQRVRLIFDDDIPHGEVRIVGHTATYTGRPCGVYVHSQARVTQLGSACFANFPAAVVKLADTPDLKSVACYWRDGSNPSCGTT